MCVKRLQVCSTVVKAFQGSQGPASRPGTQTLVSVNIEIILYDMIIIILHNYSFNVLDDI